MKSVVKKAIGGILFIDEAYALKLDEKDFYGSEAIATLLKLMEDHRDELIVIAAGYPREMQSFLDANPGLRSRFNKHLTFEDYTVEELIAIFKQISKERDYDLLPETEASLRILFSSVLESNDRRLGNGRLVRNCFDHAIKLQSARLASHGNIDALSLRQFLPTDLPIVTIPYPSDTFRSLKEDQRRGDVDRIFLENYPFRFQKQL